MPVTSRFNRKRYIKITPSRLLTLKHYDMSGGLDTYSANEVMERKFSPHLRNCRNTKRSTIATRKGASAYSTPVGETLDVQQASTTGAADQSIGIITWKAIKIIPSSSGRLTKAELRIKLGSPAPEGPVILELRSNDGGAPSETILAQGSISNASVSSSYAYVAARFMEAPALVSGTTYWLLVYLQENGENSYSISSTTTATTTLASPDSGATWAATSYDLNYKTYLSTDSPVLGQTRFYRSTPSKTTLFAHGTSHYSVNDGTGAATAFKTGLSSSATHYYYTFGNDYTYYVNGFDAPRKYDLTTDSAVGGSPEISKFVAAHKNRLFLVSTLDPSRIVFSNEGDFETFDSTDFIYVPSPKSTDPITGIVPFQDNLIIFTREAKWILYGNALSNFVLRRSAAVQGCSSQDSIDVYQNHLYFCNDTGAFRFNGTSDEQLSERIVDDWQAIADHDDINGVVWKDKYYIFCPAAGSGHNNQAIVYDILYDAIFFDTNQYIGRANIWGGGGDDEEFAQGSSLVGAIYKGETVDSDLGKPIAFEYRSKYESFDDPSRPKRVKRFYPQFELSNNNFDLTIQYDKDFVNVPFDLFVSLGTTSAQWGGGSTWGGGDIWGQTGVVKPRFSISGKFNYLQYRFKQTGVETPVEILGWISYYYLQRPR